MSPKPCALFLRPRSLLGYAGADGTTFELGKHFLKLHIRQCQHHEPMIEEVGAFRDEAVAVARRGCDHGLHRLLAELLSGLLLPGSEKPRRPRVGRAGAAPPADDAFEIGKAELLQGFFSRECAGSRRTGSPAFAIYILAS